jgi:hypothetical protein
VQALLEGVKYHLVSTLHLFVSTRVSDGNIPNNDPTVLAVLPELVIQEVEYSVSLWAGDQLDLDALGELVDRCKNSIESF